jgi:hypothetical protein
MVTLLAVFALLGVIGGSLAFCFASTVFQQMVGGLMVASGFICMVGTSVLEVLVAFKKECKTVSDNQDRIIPKLVAEIGRLRLEQEKTNKLLEFGSQSLRLGQVTTGAAAAQVRTDPSRFSEP